MFGLGITEMLVILVVVLLVFGPKRLPDMAKSLGKGIAEFKKASEDVRRGIEDAVKEEPPKAPASPSPYPEVASPSSAPEPPAPAAKSAAGEEKPSSPPPG